MSGLKTVLKTGGRRRRGICSPLRDPTSARPISVQSLGRLLARATRVAYLGTIGRALVSGHPGLSTDGGTTIGKPPFPLAAATIIRGGLARW